MSGESISWVAPHEALATIHPWRNTKTPSRRGIPLGRSWVGNKPTLYNPYEMTDSGDIPGPSAGVIGRVGHGKSNLIKMMAKRHARMGRRGSRRVNTWWVDQRDNETEAGDGELEYMDLGRALLGDEFEYIDISESRLNILDPMIPMTAGEKTNLLWNSLGLVSEGGRDITPLEKTALKVGLWVMESNAPKSSSLPLLLQIMGKLRMEDFVSWYRKAYEAVLEEAVEAERAFLAEYLGDYGDDGFDLNFSSSEFLGSCSEVGYKTLYMLDEFGSLFGGSESLYDRLARPAVGIDLSNVSSDDAKMLYELMMMSWRIALRRVPSVKFHMEIDDEWWARITILQYARHFRESIKKQRSDAVLRVFGTHRVSDTLAAGNRTGQEVETATAALRDIGSWFIGDTPQSEHELLLTFLPSHVTLDTLAVTDGLPRGHFLAIWGRNEPFVFEALRTERDIVEFESNWAARGANQAPDLELVG